MKKIICSVILVVVYMTLFVPVSYQNPISTFSDSKGNDAWTSFLHDNQNSACSTTTIDGIPSLYKKAGYPDEYYSGGVIVNNLLIVSTTNIDRYDPGVIAIDMETMEEVWRLPLKLSYCFTPPVVDTTNNHIFVASSVSAYNDNSKYSIIYCIDSEKGIVVWKQVVDLAVYGPLVYYDNHVLYQNFDIDLGWWEQDKEYESDWGDLVALNALTGEKEWSFILSYTFDQSSYNHLTPTVFGKYIIMPNSYSTCKIVGLEGIISAGKDSIFYVLDKEKGYRRLEIQKFGFRLPSVSADKDMFYISYSVHRTDKKAQYVDAYTSDLDWKWSCEIKDSVGWCSAPVFNDKYIFVRSRAGKLCCIDKKTGTIQWNKSISTDENSGDRSIYALTNDYLVTAFYEKGGSKVYIFDVSGKSSKTIWEETIDDIIGQVLLYNGHIILIGENNIYQYRTDLPKIEISPVSLEVTLEEGSQTSQMLEIKNVGKGKMEGKISSNSSWLTVNPVDFNDVGSIKIFFDTKELKVGDYKTTLSISSNGGDLSIPVSLHVTKKKDPEPIKITIELWIGKNTAFINQKPVNLDTPPMIINGRTMVPLRFIAEGFTAEVIYDASSQKIEIKLGSTVIKLTINDKNATITTEESGKETTKTILLDTPPLIQKGRTLVPVRFIAEAFGAQIDWNSQNQKITLELLIRQTDLEKAFRSNFLQFFHPSLII